MPAVTLEGFSHVGRASPVVVSEDFTTPERYDYDRNCSFRLRSSEPAFAAVHRRCSPPPRTASPPARRSTRRSTTRPTTSPRRARHRASDINNLLDGISNGVQVLQAANTGITSLQKLVDSAKSVANQVLQTSVGYSTKSNVSTTISGATANNLLGGAGYTDAAAAAGSVINDNHTLTPINNTVNRQRDLHQQPARAPGHRLYRSALPPRGPRPPRSRRPHRPQRRAVDRRVRGR